MASPEAVINAIAKYSWRSMFGVFVAAGVLVFLNKRLGIAVWEQQYHGWFIAAFILSGAVLMTYIATEMQPWFAAHTADWGMKHRGKEHLRSLSDDEKQHCKWFLDNNGSSLHHNEANGALGALIEKNILFTPGKPWGNGMRDFRIRPWALGYLRKHPELCEKS